MSTPQLALQLYSVRDALAADESRTLDRVAELEFEHVEAFRFVGRARDLRRSLDASGLSSPSAHAVFLTDQLRFGDQVIEIAPLSFILDEAETLGVGLLIDPMVEHWRTRDDVARTAERLNAAAAAAATRGIRVGYHNHAHEFQSEVDGVTAYEAFVAHLEPTVKLELDAYWAAVAGQDVVDLAARLGDRLVALHVKDGPIDPRIRASAETPADQCAAGRGDVPLGTVLRGAAALELAIVEYDHIEGDPFEAIAASARFLAERGIR